MVTEQNYLEIYPYEKWSDKTLPVFRENEEFMPTEIMLRESQTTPPRLLTEPELIDLMDKNGIGKLMCFVFLTFVKLFIIIYYLRY